VHLVPDRLRPGLGEIPDTQVLLSSLLIPNIEAEAIVAPRPVPAPVRGLAHMIVSAAKVPVFALEAAVLLTVSAQSLVDLMIATQEGITAGMIGAIVVPIVDMTMVVTSMIISAALPRVLVRLSKRGGTGRGITRAMDNCSRVCKCIITCPWFSYLLKSFLRASSMCLMWIVLGTLELERLYDFTTIEYPEIEHVTTHDACVLCQVD